MIATGQALIEAKAALAHGEFEAMIKSDLPFGARAAQMLMKIAKDGRLTNAKHVSLLPSSWGTLYELTKLDTPTFEKAIETKAIRPDMERGEAQRLRTGERRIARLARMDRMAKAEEAKLPANAVRLFREVMPARRRVPRPSFERSVASTLWRERARLWRCDRRGPNPL